MAAHARRSASGNKRWLNCPGSIRESIGRPNESSGAARLGTAAHGLGEYCLMCPELWPTDMVGGVIYLDMAEDAHVYPPDPDGAELAEIAAHGAEGHEAFPIDSDMADAVQVYVSTVREELESRPDAQLMVEHRSDLCWLIGYDWKDEWDGTSHISPNGMFWNHNLGCVCNEDGTPSHGPMFGTNDAGILQLFEHLTIVDYKHGQGVIVEVAYPVQKSTVTGDGVVYEQGLEGNTQELQYALGVAHDVQWAFETLTLIIVQPRARHADGGVRRYETSKAELRAFEETLRAGAKATEQPDAPLKAGDWCQFCPAAGKPCVALMDRAIAEAQVDFDDDGEPEIGEIDEGTTDARLAQALRVIPILDVFSKAVIAEATHRLKSSQTGLDETIGYKLVRKKANRKWLDEATAARALIGRGYPEDGLYAPRKMLSPSKVEGLRPKALLDQLKADGVKAPVKALKAIVEELQHKPEGGVTIAPIADPRPAVAPQTLAAADFEEYDEDQP